MNNTNDFINSILHENTIKSILIESEKRNIFNQLKFSYKSDLKCDELCRLSFVLFNYIFSNEENITKENIEETYKLLKSIEISSEKNIQCFSDIYGIDGVDSIVIYYFYLAIISLKADKVINIRIDLKDLIFKDTYDNWRYKLLNKIFEAYLLLIRKQEGFSDIKKALCIISDLQQEQEKFEENYLKQFQTNFEIEEAYLLLSIYHLSKTLVETANYLINGYDYKERLDTIIRRHLDIAKKLSKNNQKFVNILQLFEYGFNTIFKNAIWTNTKFDDKIRELCKRKASFGIIELLPSQRESLSNKFLDVASNVTVLQLPTSAGKTLLAEFNIIVTKALRSDAKIVYIVPSRALVNQVYHELRFDLEPLGFIVEKTSSAIEIDPTEDSFLAGADNIDIIVSTPEKLDLLIRRNHPSVEDVSLFVIDEAHTIQNGERGAKLELLIAIIRRERPNAKYLVLSPFIKDTGSIIAEWLGGGNSISVNWKPSEKLILGINNKKTKKINKVYLEVLPSPYESTQPIEKQEFLNPYQLESNGKKEQILEFSIKHFSEDNKTILILCGGKKLCNNRAEFIYNKIDNYKANDDVQLVRKFIEDEIGRATMLSKVIKKGIVTHHSGMSDEVKLLVEHLIREKQIQYVCSTTTIAEGVNFPVSTVFFDDYRKGDIRLSTKDFWNIAGRAGRTLVDNYGKIILPFNSIENINHAKNMIKNCSDEITSVLAELFENADAIEKTMQNENGLADAIRSWSNSISPLVQYFVHLLTIGEKEYFVSQIEDLFKDSLEYYLLDSEEKKRKFISICKSIYVNIQSKYQNKGALAFADKTGFSVPSVLRVMADAKQNPNIRDLKKWDKDEMFNLYNSDNLTEKISVIAALKETKLGIDDSNSLFNPELYAKIIINWVKGKKLVNIAETHPSYSIYNQEDKEIEQRITNFVQHMNEIRFKASWGLSALEGIIRGNENEIKDSYIPSMVYFGVDTEKALALRMIGVPRILSSSLQVVLKNDLNQYTYRDLRSKISQMKDSDFDDLKPKNSSLTGSEWKRVTEILVN